jgi:hypothetical protein
MQPADFPAHHQIELRAWSARLIGADLIELQRGRDSCLVNIAWAPEQAARVVHASEAQSPWFPDLLDRLHELLPQLPGRFVLV